MIAEMCVACGVRLASGGAGGARSKLAAGLLGIFLGAFGIHRFYLGYTGIAVIQLVLGLLGFVTFFITSFASWVWGLIEGILILSGSINKDATGRPLRE
jgi:TM2 domain-containing membrane protein YozV